MRRKVSLFALLAGAALALLLVLLLRSWGPWTTSPVPEEAAASYAANALAEYIPADAGAVLSFDLRELRAAPVMRGRLAEPLRRLVSRGELELPWVSLVGIDPWEGIDRVRVVLPAGEPARPLWLVHGRFDPDRFLVGPGQLLPRREGGRQLYEYLDSVVGPTWLAPAGDTLVVSVGRARLKEALDHAAQPRPVSVRDPTLRELLTKVNRTRMAWLVASLEALGPTARLENRALDAVLGPVLRRARSVEGGLSAGEDMKAEFTVRTTDEATAEQLEDVLKSVILVAQGAPLLLGDDKDLLPLLQLLGTGETVRDGPSVMLSCRLGAEP